jgi:hypothetical protein
MVDLLFEFLIWEAFYITVGDRLFYMLRVFVLVLLFLFVVLLLLSGWYCFLLD